jgi:peptide chain release factor 3
MKMEQDRGISVSASAMSFDFDGWRFNLVDTPGHSDFSEDTYRTLTAVDAAIMVIDGAKGVESQTRKLFEVCRLRDLPILTFCNKMDREARDTFEIIDEIQENLAIDVTPASWPIGMGRDFLGCYDLLHDRLELMDRADRNRVAESIRLGARRPEAGRAHPRRSSRPSCARRSRWRASCCRPSTAQAFLEGHLTPIWFGSAINSFGVRELMEGIAEYGPPPQPQRADRARSRPRRTRSPASSSRCRPTWTPSTATAWPSCASLGAFQRGMKLHHVRTGKPMAVTNPVLFLAADRELAEEAWAGDIIGIPNHGQLRIGDALTEGEALRFTGIPSFAPELLRTARAGRPDEGQAPGKGADPVRRGRRRQGLQADDRLGLHRRRGRRAAVRRAGQPDRAGIRPAGALRADAVHLGPLGLGPQGGGRGLRRRQQGPHGHRPRRRPGLPDPPAMGHRPRRARLARREADATKEMMVCFPGELDAFPL